jgi:hypothetical protein
LRSKLAHWHIELAAHEEIRPPDIHRIYHERQWPTTTSSARTCIGPGGDGATTPAPVGTTTAPDSAAKPANNDKIKMLLPYW